MKFFFIFTLCLLFLLLLFASSEYPTCGSCYCSTSSNGTGPCPIIMPDMSFSNETIDRYKTQRAIAGAFSLFCNPYEDASCTTTPPQPSNISDEASAVCAFQYSSCVDYTLATFASRSEAQAAGAVVTHFGVCGLCSETADLAVYLRQDFTDAGKVCATRGLLDQQKGLECYQSLGLSLECAKIWNYDGTLFRCMYSLHLTSYGCSVRYYMSCHSTPLHSHSKLTTLALPHPPPTTPTPTHQLLRTYYQAKRHLRRGNVCRNVRGGP